MRKVIYRCDQCGKKAKHLEYMHIEHGPTWRLTGEFCSELCRERWIASIQETIAELERGAVEQQEMFIE